MGFRVDKVPSLSAIINTSSWDSRKYVIGVNTGLEEAGDNCFLLLPTVASLMDDDDSPSALDDPHVSMY